MTPHAPMHRTVRFGIACTILSVVLVLLGIGFAAGYAVADHVRGRTCSVTR